jgi:hypothetical protein
MPQENYCWYRRIPNAGVLFSGGIDLVSYFGIKKKTLSGIAVPHGHLFPFHYMTHRRIFVRQREEAVDNGKDTDTAISSVSLYFYKRNRPCPSSVNHLPQGLKKMAKLWYNTKEPDP